MKAFFLLSGIFFLFPIIKAYPQYTSTSFYIIAHQDDWQYFMGINASHDLKNPQTKVVFIYITAGDACQGTGTCSSGFPYFASREEGAKNSVLVASEPERHPDSFPSASPNTIRWIDGHAISTWQSGNALMYFLRLPDGRAHGENFSRNSCSLNPADSSYINLFRRKQFQKLSDICGLTAYHGWNELAMTISAILLSEFKGCSCILHTHEFSPSINIGTHVDHRESGLLADFAGRKIPGMQIVYHLDYITAGMEENLTTVEAEAEFKLFMAYNNAKTGHGCASDFIEGDMEWFRRNYISRFILDARPYDPSSADRGFVVEISPNPAFKATTVSIVVPFDDTITCLVFDMQGKLIENLIPLQHFLPGTYKYELRNLTQGVYILKMVTQSGITTQAKIIIN
jgi:hypothetical protein